MKGFNDFWNSLLTRRRFLWLAGVSLLSLRLGGSAASAEPDGSPAATILSPPAADKVIQRIAFGSCCEQDQPQPIWNTIAAANPDMFLFIGDNVYSDTEDMAVMQGNYDKLGTKPEFAAFRSKIPVLATWDDHDYGINDGGVEYPKKVEAKKIMLDFFGEPANSPRRQRDGVYTSYTFGPDGKRLSLIMLDLRWFRSALIYDKAIDGYVPNPDLAATMLGEDQWLWLEQELKKPADLRIIASSTQFCSPDHKWEKWANYPHEKKRMLDLLDKLSVKNAVFLSGDMHYGELSAEQTAAGTTVYDLTSSGMNFVENGTQYANKNRISLFDTKPNFGYVEIDWGTAGATKVSLQVRDDSGNTVISKDVTV